MGRGSGRGLGLNVLNAVHLGIGLVRQLGDVCLLSEISVLDSLLVPHSGQCRIHLGERGLLLFVALPLLALLLGL